VPERVFAKRMKRNMLRPFGEHTGREFTASPGVFLGSFFVRTKNERKPNQKGTT